MNDAGKSARELSESVGRAAERLERKAANARRAEQNYAAGAAGEVAVAEALAPLTAAGWHVLNDREMPGGSSIDHIVVGQGAVIVLDAKAWNTTLEVHPTDSYTPPDGTSHGSLNNWTGKPRQFEAWSATTY
ncbi:MAG: nuclease-related domain-containing protein [Microthrixaceae bacterium]